LDKPVPRNDVATPLTKFCLAVEEHRRTNEGRVRTASEFLQHFFPFNDAGSTDLVFRYLPREVRGPILANWRIRGLKASLRDSDEKVESVVYDALTAGDIDADSFESGLAADVLIEWIPLASWWSLWRGGKLSKRAMLKAFETAYALSLFDAKWFLDTIESRNGKLRGTDVIAEGLTKADLTEWVRRLHDSGNGSPTGLIAAIGWEKIVTQTPNDVLVAALDAFAVKTGLSIASNPSTSDLGPDMNATMSSRSAAPPRSSSMAPQSVPPPMRSRRPEPALLSEDKMLAAMEDDTRNTIPPSPLDPAIDDPEQTGVYGDELAAAAAAAATAPGPDGTDDEAAGPNLRDRIDFIRRRLP
jgi:hypothetical protein